MQRGGQVAAPDHRRRRAGSQHGDLQALLQADQTRAADALEQRSVGLAAAQEHVLAVVHLETAALHRVGGAAEPAPHLHERDLRARLRAVERGGDAGEAPADHEHAALRAHDAGGVSSAGTLTRAHAPLPSTPRAATQAFSRAGSETRRTSTCAGSSSMRSSSRR